MEGFDAEEIVAVDTMLLDPAQRLGEH
jgi:hypothetical protein